MENFNQHLNQYIQRAGISDAELARSVGVSRQTIFRWREGSTARPRHREDVLSMGKKLRLTAVEQDTLLLAAGFRPEENLVETAEATTPTSQPPAEEEEEVATTSPAIPTAPVGAEIVITPNKEVSQQPVALAPEATLTEVAPVTMIIKSKKATPMVAFLVIGLLLGISVLWWFKPQPIIKTPTPNTIINHTKNPDTPNTALAPAMADETLIIVTHFANYASSEVGYNVAGRLSEALQREIEDSRLENMRVEIWPDVVGERDLALQTGQKISATLVIYGEYDVGRVVVKMAHPENRELLTNPAVQRYVDGLQDLSTTINSDLPQQVRSLALIGLGQIYLRKNETDLARLFLMQARNNLKGDKNVDDQTWGLVNFYLGITYYYGDPPDLDGAIESYSEAIEVWPNMISSRLNRGAAYEARKKTGDLQLALQDAQAVVAIAPDWASGYNNRASIRLIMGGQENLKLAQADLDKTLDLNPDMPEAYINQAYLDLKQGQTMVELIPALEKALELRPGYATALNTFCWGYAVEGQPETAMPYCQQAVESDPKPTYLDSRGVAYALLGDYAAAIADFESYTTWLSESQSIPNWEQDLELRQSWITTLQQGENPFTPTVLAQLRADFGE